MGAVVALVGGPSRLAGGGGMSARKPQVLQGGGGGAGGFTNGPFVRWIKPRSKQPVITVGRVGDLGFTDLYGEADEWVWIRQSPNRVYVAQSVRSWTEKRHCVAAARSEIASLSGGARLVIDGQEVTP